MNVESHNCVCGLSRQVDLPRHSAGRQEAGEKSQALVDFPCSLCRRGLRSSSGGESSTMISPLPGANSNGRRPAVTATQVATGAVATEVPHAGEWKGQRHGAVWQNEHEPAASFQLQ